MPDVGRLRREEAVIALQEDGDNREQLFRDYPECAIMLVENGVCQVMCPAAGFPWNRSPGHSELMKREQSYLLIKSTEIVSFITWNLSKKGVAGEVILGYEPADDDMMILRVARNK